MPPMDMPPHFGFEPMPPLPAPSMNAIPPTITVLIMSILVMALDLGLRIASTWVVTEQQQSEIDKQNALSQLQNLQSQVSPHFFMNTLNNIHALVDLDSARAKRTIIELSDLMSYLLYDCSNTDNILLQKELDFVENYINLMRLRFSSQVRINFSYDDDVPKVKIPPLLFLNFIENAFKYGVDYEQESIINIHFGFTNSHIEMKVLNSNHSEGATPRKHGLGISNTRRRLDLIYGSSYTLDISEKEAIYFVNLKIPIQ
ncbi:MAG: histidine kinase [Rikenellaceae bacterium]